MKRIFSFILIFISVLMLSSCIFGEEDDGTITIGDFVYMPLEGEDNKLRIVGISEEGREKATIVFPSIVDGYYIDGISDKIWTSKSKLTYVSNVENVYFPAFYCDSRLDYSYNRSMETTLFISDKNDFGLYWYTLYRRGMHIYMSYEDYIWMLTNRSYVTENIKPANVVYYSINCEASSLEYVTFFIDDCDGTVVNVIPPTPYRKGYTFTGWYKEEECINKWDFEKDIIPAKEYDEEGNYIFEETSIYAGWEKCE